MGNQNLTAGERLAIEAARLGLPQQAIDAARDDTTPVEDTVNELIRSLDVQALQVLHTHLEKPQREVIEEALAKMGYEMPAHAPGPETPSKKDQGRQ